MKRKQTLKRLLEFTEPVDWLAAELKKKPWDFDGKPVVLKWSNINNACFQLIKGEITESELEDWANLIECCENITCTKGTDNAIYQLANPLLVGKSITAIVSDLTHAYVGTVSNIFKTQIGLIVTVYVDLDEMPTIFIGSKLFFEKSGEYQLEGFNGLLEKSQFAFYFKENTQPPEIGEMVRLMNEDEQMEMFIGLKKIAENETCLTYRLECTDGRTGEAEVSKITGEVFCTKKVPNSPERVHHTICRNLRKHWEKADFPERTCYAT